MAHADPGLMPSGETPAAAAAWAGRLRSWLPASLLIFVAASFALPREPAYALVFYLAVPPCLLARLVQRRSVPAPDAAQVLAAALIVFSGLTLLWGSDDGHRSWRFAGGTLATLGFLLAMILSLREPAARRRLGSVLVAAGAVNAVLCIAVFVITHPVYPRLRGWGATSHPILGAAVMTIPALTALARGLAPVAPRGRRALNLAAFAAMVAFILLTESRGPLLAGLAAMLFLCAVSVWRVRALAVITVAAALWFALPQAARRHGETVLVQRGSSHRFQIWEYTFGLIRDRPILGHGLAANLHLDVGDLITFPHNLYLSLLFYSGAAGFLIFLALACLITWRLLARALGGGLAQDPEWAWLTALWIDLLMIGLTDLGQITKGPGPIWFIVWVPVGLLLTAMVATPARRDRSSGQVVDA